MVGNPMNGHAEDEAPLWVYLHGGGSGYLDEDGNYIATNAQDEDTWNPEETFDDRTLKRESEMDISSEGVENEVDRTYTEKVVLTKTVFKLLSNIKCEYNCECKCTCPWNSMCM